MVVCQSTSTHESRMWRAIYLHVRPPRSLEPLPNLDNQLEIRSVNEGGVFGIGGTVHCPRTTRQQIIGRSHRRRPLEHETSVGPFQLSTPTDNFSIPLLVPIRPLHVFLRPSLQIMITPPKRLFVTPRTSGPTQNFHAPNPSPPANNNNYRFLLQLFFACDLSY